MVWQALTTRTFDDLRITRPLVALRYLGRRRTSGAKLVLTEGPTTIFDLDAPRYAIGGAVGRPWQRTPERRPVTSIDAFGTFDEPGWVKYLVDFELTAEGDATRLSTETRGYSTNDHARRRFRFYWAAIRLGSGVIRRDVLASVARASAHALGQRRRRRRRLGTLRQVQPLAPCRTVYHRRSKRLILPGPKRAETPLGSAARDPGHAASHPL